MPGGCRDSGSDAKADRFEPTGDFGELSEGMGERHKKMITPNERSILAQLSVNPIAPEIRQSNGRLVGSPSTNEGDGFEGSSETDDLLGQIEAVRSGKPSTQEESIH